MSDQEATTDVADTNTDISPEGAAQAVEAANNQQTEDAQTETTSDVVDIDGLDKFVWQGKEYTPEELQKAVLFQKDYTKKSQAIAEERKFADNLSADLENVRRSPQLAERFKELYPEKYHAVVDMVVNSVAKTKESEQVRPKEDEGSLPDSLLEKLNSMENKLKEYEQKSYEERVQAEGAKLDAKFSTLSEKYPLADEDAVNNHALRIVEANRDNPDFVMTDAHWDKLFRLDHDARGKKYSEYEKSRIKDQVSKGKRAADVGPGGLAPGRERKKMTFDDATEQMIQDLGGR
jgi:hypothetical protein